MEWFYKVVDFVRQTRRLCSTNSSTLLNDSIGIVFSYHGDAKQNNLVNSMSTCCNVYFRVVLFENIDNLLYFCS